MYGQMTAGSWIYIGSQGIVQGTYETFVEAGVASTSAATWPAAGSSPPAWAAWVAHSRWRPSFAGACSLNIECQQIAHRFPPEAPGTSTSRPRTSTTRWHDARKTTPSEGKAISIALLGNAAEIVLPELRARAACAPIWSPTRPPPRHRSTATCRWAGRGGVAGGATARSGAARRAHASRHLLRGARARRCWNSRPWASPRFDYGNNIRQVALRRTA